MNEIHSNSVFKKFTGIMAAVTFCIAIPSSNAIASEKIIWQPDNAQISVYSTKFLDLYEIAQVNPETGQYETAFEKDVKNGIRLLMVDGGFVKSPETIINKDGTVFISLEKFAAVTGVQIIEYETAGNVLILKKEDISLTIPNLDSDEAVINGREIIMTAKLEKVDNDIYVPLRFMTEIFGGTVQYISDFTETVCEQRHSNYPDINIIVIETGREYGKIHNIDEGLEVIKELSVEKHKQIVDLLNLRGWKFGVDGTEDDYNPLDIVYTGYNLGRYYVYKLKGFEELPIFFNKYTGEVFSCMAGTPFLWIDNEFPNLNYIY